MICLGEGNEELRAANWRGNEETQGPSQKAHRKLTGSGAGRSERKRRLRLTKHRHQTNRGETFHLVEDGRFGVDESSIVSPILGYKGPKN